MNLESLELGDNRITHLQDDTFNPLINLQRLILYENELKEVAPRMLQGLKSLKMLDIGNNDISTIPAGF